MFKKICIELNAANPQIPFEACCPFSGSAASFTILNVPRPLGKRTVDAVYVELTDVAGVTRSFAAERVGSAWGATVPASAVGESGIVTGGVCVWASGTDDAGAPVDCWILGTGDLRVLKRDGTVAPDVIRHNVHGYTVKPDDPRDFDLAPASDAPAAPLELYLNGAWRPLGGGGSVSWADVTNKPTTFPPSAHTHALADVGGLEGRLQNISDDVQSAADTANGAVQVASLAVEKADAAATYVITDAVDGGTSVKINGETVTMFADLLAKCRTGRSVLYGQATTVETGYAFYTAASVTDSVIQFQVSGMLYDKSNVRYGMYVRRIKIVPRANGGLLVYDSGLEGPFAKKIDTYAKGKQDDGSPVDQELHDFFTKSDTFATDHKLKNAALEDSVNALIDYKVGDVNAVLAAALNGSEVA